MTPTNPKQKISVTQIPAGAALKIRGEDKGKEEVWYGQVDRVNVEKGTLEVALLAPRGNVLVLEGEGFVPQTIPVESVMAYEPIEPLTNPRAHRRAWFRIGLRLVRSTREADTFIELAREDSDELVDVGDSDEDESYDPSDSDSDDSMGSLEDFIVPDDEADEPFTHAKPSDEEVREGAAERVREMNQAVHEYNDWVPQTDREKAARGFIDRMEKKYADKDDERQFAKGKSVSYNKPPLNG